MKKKICLFIVATMILGVVFAGCGTSGNTNATSNLPEALAGDHKTPALIYTITHNKSKFFLLRDQYMYHLGKMLKGEENYRLGIAFFDSSVYNLCRETEDITTTDPSAKAILSTGDISIPVIQKDDKIYLINEEARFGFTAKPIDFIGFTTLIYKGAGSLHIGTSENDPCQINQIEGDVDSLKVYRADKDHHKTGDPLPLEEICKLDYGEKINVYWEDKGTQKGRGLYADATCSYYKYADQKPVEIPILGEEDKYTIYDPTKLDKGYWALCVGDEPYSVILVQ